MLATSQHQYIHIVGIVCANPTTYRGIREISAVLAAIRRQPLLDRAVGWAVGHFTTWPADDFGRFLRSGPREAEPIVSALPPAAPPERSPEPAAIAPVTFEMRFARLHRDGSFDAMWDLIAEDAQRAWGSRHRFVERMRRQASDYDVVGAEVTASQVVPEWTDRHRRRTYRNVARLHVSYRIRQADAELEIRREVHLVPAAAGWRTLFYPAETAGRSLK